MAKKRSTKRALLMSALSLLLCVSMLIGSTFAWFTDSVTSAGNKIQSGTLKVDLELLEKNGTWTSIKDTENALFNYNLWEPGYTEVKILRVVNEGNLALKWVAKFISENKLSALADAIDVYVNTEVQSYPADRNDLTGWKNVGTVAQFVNTIQETTNGTLLPKDAEGNGGVAYLGLALKMRESAGNEYQALDLGGAFDIQIFATQYTSEFDSFNDQYDADAPKLFNVNGTAYDNAADALAAANDGDSVYISSLDAPITIDKKITLTIENAKVDAGAATTFRSTLAAAPNGNAITVNADATIVAKGYNSVTGAKNADGIYVAEGVKLTLTGTGTLIAVGNGGTESQEEYNSGIGGSGIDVDGTIVISNLKSLTAEGWGKHAFGIGGATESIVIENSNVNYAKGGMVKTAIEDNNYGKNEPEAGAAIGSNVDGAVITITNSTIKMAEGGSKAAGIGAMYHTGVTVNITDSNVTAIGGTSSAGIGGSRITKHESAETQAINVNIVNSTVNATGGDFAAGIGSGYNTYCAAVRPVITVNIDAASNITAQGGLLGAGVGTGHNVIDFVGNIACDTSNIHAGSSEDPSWCCWGNPCTIAKDVGLGVYSIKNFHSDVVMIGSADELVALGGTKINGNYVLTADIDMTGKTMKSMELSGGASVTFLGNGHTISNLELGAAGIHGMTGAGNEVAGLFDLSAPATTVSLNVSDLTIKGATVACSGYAAPVVGYNSNSGTVITLNNVDVVGADVTAESVAGLVAYTTGPVNLNDCDVSGLALTGEAGRPEKVGAYIGTANGTYCTVAVENCTNSTAYNDFGRVIYGAVVNGVTYVSNMDQLKTAVTGGATELFLSAGEYDIDGCAGKTLTISGTKDTVLKLKNEGEDGCDYAFGNAGGFGHITFNGVTIDTTLNTGSYKGFAYMNGTYNNCNFVGSFTTVNAGSHVFNGCTFNFNGYLWTWGATEVTFDGCTFEGDSRNILAHGAASTVINIKDCDFAATAKGYTYGGDWTAAVEIDPTGANTYTINFLGENTLNDNYSGWYRIKDGSTGHTFTGLN